MRVYLKLNSLLLVVLLSACANPYEDLHQEKLTSSAYRFQPKFDKAIYRCIVDGNYILKKYHLSGLLIFKQLKTGTKRAVFQNELGLTFFDMEWDREDHFKLNKIISQLDKDAVVKTLRKDLEMLLMIGSDKKSEILLSRDRGKEQLHRLNIEGGFVYYITNGNQLIKIENANNKKRIVTVDVGEKNNDNAMPKTLLFDHHKARFTISLTKIESDVNE